MYPFSHGGKKNEYKVSPAGAKNFHRKNRLKLKVFEFLFSVFYSCLFLSGTADFTSSSISVISLSFGIII